MCKHLIVLVCKSWFTERQKCSSSMADEDQAMESGDAKGPKMPYFHRTLSVEDKQLIGDITPKQIKAGDDKNICSTLVGGTSSGSAWNAAQTWEEKNCTEWAMEAMKRTFMQGELACEGAYTVSIIEDAKVRGHANLTHSRGKARYLYEIEIDLEVEVVGGADWASFGGTLAVTDVINDMLEDIELNMTWKTRPGNSLYREVNNMVTGKPMKGALMARLKAFDAEYKELR